MCRLALFRNISEDFARDVAEALRNGGTLECESESIGEYIVVIVRFPVTSERLAYGAVPVRGHRYTVTIDGEIYGHKNSRYRDSAPETDDLGYLMSLLDRFGEARTMSDLDFEGTLLICDRSANHMTLYVDQAAVRGWFYAAQGDRWVGASEHAVVHEATHRAGWSDTVPISRLEGGCMLRWVAGVARKRRYRHASLQMWSSSTAGIEALNPIVDGVRRALRESVIRRIPRERPFAALCSGGVDSSTILAMIVDYLRFHGELHRLVVVTLGRETVGGVKIDDDLTAARAVCKLLGVESQLLVIDPNELDEIRRLLLVTEVFCPLPRLIPPNPVRTQIRHTVTMAATLARLVQIHPEIRVVLGGDGADELFGGYPSMHRGCTTPEMLVNRIRAKTRELPLNDVARVALASLRGCASALAALGAPVRPIEVRLPYLSHLVMLALRSASPLLATAVADGSWLPKLPLRLVALQEGLSVSTAFRRKIPFHEGATGVANTDTDEVELELAARYLASSSWSYPHPSGDEHYRRLSRGFIQRDIETLASGGSEDHGAFLLAGCASGVLRLVAGDCFPNEMSETVHGSSLLKPGESWPPALIVTTSRAGGYEVATVSSSQAQGGPSIVFTTIDECNRPPQARMEPPCAK